MSDSSTQINSKCIDKSSKKSYINWKLPNCGGISIHGEKTCFVTIKDSDKSECKCVNPPDLIVHYTTSLVSLPKSTNHT